MTNARLSITLPDRTWVGELTRRHPEMTVHVLAAVPDEHRGFAIARLDGPTLGAFLADMRSHPAILESSLIRRSETQAVVHFETDAPLLLFASRESGMPLRLPVEIRDGCASAEFSGADGRLQRLGEQLDALGLEYDLERVQSVPELTELLTDRQLEVIEAAVDAGYYAQPRRCSMTDLAASLDVAKSTCSEILHRAEGRLVEHYVDRVRSDEPPVIEPGVSR